MKLVCSRMLIVLSLFATIANAGPLADRWRERHAASAASGNMVGNVAYGSDALQTFDVYLPGERQTAAPVIIMFHGGAWKYGDKTMRRTLEAKRERWVSRGFVFISANYRLLPAAEVEDQLHDVALAIATAQGKAADWGGDRRKFILMGHSAGAHLAALYSAAPRFAMDGASPLLGSVVLDSAALNVVRIMEQKHYGLYDRPFGTDRAYWQAMSPYHQLARGAAPMLVVCSSRRTDSCPQADAYAQRARTAGMRVEVLPEDLSHGQINSELGVDSAYTRAVERFMASLDPR